MLNLIPGKKTYGIAIVMAAVSLWTYFVGPVPGIEIANPEHMFFEALAIVGLRKGIAG